MSLTNKDNTCERSEPRVVLMVGRARRVGTEPVRGNIFLPTIPRRRSRRWWWERGWLSDRSRAPSGPCWLKLRQTRLILSRARPSGGNGPMREVKGGGLHRRLQGNRRGSCCCSRWARRGKIPVCQPASIQSLFEVTVDFRVPKVGVRAMPKPFLKASA